MKEQPTKHLTLSPFSSKLRNGFTLIELLIVISIIALLAAISIFALAGARETGRDAKRKADLETIRSALEFYKADCGNYPVGSLTPLKAGCAPANNVYVKEVPKDSSTGRLYAYSPDPPLAPTSYTLCAALEGVDTPVADCASCGTGTCTYKTTNP